METSRAREILEETAWKRPPHYGGFSPDGDYLIASQHRESDVLSRANWQSACADLGAQAYDEGQAGFINRPAVYHWRAGHWAVRWVEYLMIRRDAPQSTIEAAADIICSLSDYPVLDDELFSAMEHDEAAEIWRNCYDPQERAEYIRNNRDQFEFRSIGDMLGCVRGEYFAGYAPKLIGG